MTIIKPLGLSGRNMFRPHAWILIAMIFVAIIPAIAQDTYVSDNEVNAVAKLMYCPVCENIPLDECQTTTCIDWKEEIRFQLAQGDSPDQIIDGFVVRFGDHVVGTPRDPVLRMLTIIIPIIGGLLAIAAGVYTFTSFGKHQKLKIENEPDDNPTGTSDDTYRQRLEQDLFSRR